MTEFGYQNNILNDCRYGVSKNFDIYTILKDLVNYNLITEWQAGYVTALYQKFNFNESYEQLLLFIHSQIDKEV